MPQYANIPLPYQKFDLYTTKCVTAKGKAMKLSEWFGVVGASLAVAISWSVNQSILWAMFHGLCAWFYVIYYAIWG
jgi:hypothetical protein